MPGIYTPERLHSYSATLIHEMFFTALNRDRDISFGIALATSWTVGWSNPGGGEILRTRPERLWDPPSLVYNLYRVSFPTVQRPGRGVNQPPPPSNAEAKEIVELYLYSLSLGLYRTSIIITYKY
jgi:hypothetical protein